jgi:hypothetical protein
MFVRFFYFDDIFVKQALNIMEFEQEKHIVDKDRVNDIIQTSENFPFVVQTYLS